MDYQLFLESLEEASYLRKVKYLNAKDLTDFNIKAAYYICKEIHEKQLSNENGYVVIGLSGGRTPIDVYKNICLIKDVEIDKSKLIFFIIDERYKSDDHKFSNYKNIKFLFYELRINEKEQLFRPDTTKNLVECIREYNEKIKYMLKKYKKIDIAILGMGSDFHIASLFPNIFYNIYMNNYQNGYIYEDKSIHHMQNNENDNENDSLNLLKEYVYFTTTNNFDVRKRITVSLDVLGNALSKIFLLNSAEKLDLWKNMLLKSYIDANYNLYPAVYLIDTCNTTVITCGYENYTKQLQEIYDSNNSISSHTSNSFHKRELLTIIVFGCSGDLAKKKIYPAIFKLFCNKLLPKDLLVIGFARTAQDFESFFDKLVIYLKKCLHCYEDLSISQKRDLLNSFKHRCRYYIGNYACSESFENFNKYLIEVEQEAHSNEYTCYYNIIGEDKSCSSDLHKRGTNDEWSRCPPTDATDVAHSTANYTYVINRMLYLALPPHIFVSTLKNYKKHCLNSNGTDKILLEKPFGNDLESFKILSKQILENFNEQHIYRIDHYLGKDMVSGLMKLKFTNTFLLSLMNRHFIKCIKITLKETKGVYGRGQYFDPYGIIRDVMQNHMLQLLTLITMEDPIDLSDESVKNEKVKILKCIPSIKLEDSIIGQYIKSNNYQEDNSNEDNIDESKRNHSYHDDPHIDANSITPTFCTCILYINSINWYGVPIIFKTGKGLNKDICEIRIQFHNIMGSSDENMYNNEFVIILQPVEVIYLKMMIKKTGCEEMEEVQLNLTVNEKNKKANVPEAYETLLLECFKGYKKKFISDEELYESWRIFTPLLNELQEKQIKPLKYPFGSSGPKEVFDLVKKYYNYGKNYTNTPEFVRKSSIYEDNLLDINWEKKCLKTS
ncbi:glucose-6-phosphate dehydrogenase-6-phosphogluconolactonase [Plasmodium brasilianum]|uniref:glucose-6-phosphate dehydrogenase (NADP(+)) n=2 Tax=Plasmodium (Plasmodium) TaxID=418103 RepID=A0A1A8WAC7_PLAMA|nr:glucose-6-phosphate dehydrogenase-6-phosphogluconolactonase, putative [Plasmodium malariae]KAI4836746.1 glucose-6-phosphate dehydrogenase-6-phosphogluconolactonase [Plasmodium brasilianum]SBS88665.1 glucose-6-phosphate 1-dehydrogenase, putative [Plasmodium malariae]SCO94035.1 glucose-6-phosphate dehydrogenase-6-phosphogluconolactonase, putative [Plasmodium malariae]